MSEWKVAWNSPAVQEIRAALARGEFSQYCLDSVSCPIVQRHLGTRGSLARVVRPSTRRLLVGVINRLFLRAPARLYRWLAAGVPPDGRR